MDHLLSNLINSLSFIHILKSVESFISILFYSLICIYFYTNYLFDVEYNSNITFDS
jgi:hypothetical protein